MCLIYNIFNFKKYYVNLYEYFKQNVKKTI